MLYLMVTDWEDHWDNIRNSQTYFTEKMLKEVDGNNLSDNTTTIFIKRKKETKKAEKIWIGKVTRIRKVTAERGNKFWFHIDIDKEIPLQDAETKFQQYINYSPGWYTIKEIPEMSRDDYFDPRFFTDLIKTNDWQTFEKYTYYLIRSLGLNITHRFDTKNQKGKADGFFKFRNFSVLYDCTLKSDFKDDKDQQIENFCAQLKKDILRLNRKKITIKDSSKNVWIITRNGTSRIIDDIDEIIVKEVPVESVIELYRRRIREEIDNNSFESLLKNI